LPQSDTAMIVAVSGGADSTALLLALDELNKVGPLSLEIFVAHLDHKIRESSAKDAKAVATLAKSLGYTPVIGRSNVAEIAATNSDNLEQAARSARYDFLQRTALRKHASYVLSGHTMDDQAETVLLRLMRGSAAAGLGGMEKQRPLEVNSKVTLVRPILWARRTETEEYCRFRNVAFLSDEMNDDEKFARVKVRKQLLPLMKTFNNRVVEALSRTATLLREDTEVLVGSAGDLLELAAVATPNSSKSKGNHRALRIDVLLSAPPALRRRALREWITTERGNVRRLEMVHLLAVERLLEKNRGGKVVELPNGGHVRRSRGQIEFVGASLRGLPPLSRKPRKIK